MNFWHWFYYPHMSRDSVSPVCGIFTESEFFVGVDSKLNTFFLCFTSLHLFIKAVGYVLSSVLNLRFNLQRCPGLKPPSSLLIASIYLVKN